MGRWEGESESEQNLSLTSQLDVKLTEAGHQRTDLWLLDPSLIRVRPCNIKALNNRDCPAMGVASLVVSNHVDCDCTYLQSQ